MLLIGRMQSPWKETRRPVGDTFWKMQLVILGKVNVMGSFSYLGWSPNVKTSNPYDKNFWYNLTEPEIETQTQNKWN